MTIAPSAPAHIKVWRTPRAALTGPVSAYDSGSRPIEIIQSRLDTRPRSCEGTWRCLAVAHAIVPAVSSVLNRTLASIRPHRPLAKPYPATAAVATVQTRYMKTRLRRGRPN